jgi:3-phenylpropionate/cinnamic acid dioxygenase small subunit
MLDTQAPIDSAAKERISEFCVYESRLLDQRRFNQWLDLLTEDFTYVVPAPLTPDSPLGQPWSEASSVLDETKHSLQSLWATRFLPENIDYAWGENPPQRTRRFVTNLAISSAERDNEYAVESNLLLSFVRRSDPASLIPAGRHDTIRDEGGVLKLARRVVYLDQTLMTVTHMRLIF